MSIIEIPEMLTIKEAANRSKISYDAIRKMVLADKIVYIRCGKKILINWNKFCDYLNGEIKEPAMHINV